MEQEILRMQGITKRFGSTIALQNVDLTVYAGEIRGLIGENGSGKSTISSIAAGMQKANEGKMFFCGEPWEPKSMLDALEKGIGMIVQESGTVPGITVAENMFLGETGAFRGILGTINRAEMNRRADAALDAIGVKQIRGSMMLDSLDFQARKLVEIAKVVMKSPKVLVVDETTTALSFEGRQILYDVMNKYRDSGKAVVFISHDLEEIMEVCSTLTVLRDGSLIRTFKKEEFDADAIRMSMIGRELQGDYYRSDFVPSANEEIALQAEHITTDDITDIDLTLHKGEIVGIGGLSQCGMHTLGKVLFGAIKPQSGKVSTGDGTLITDEATAMDCNIGYVAKDRDVESLSLSASVKDNIAIAGTERFAIGKFLLTERKERAYVDAQIKSLSVKCSDRGQSVAQLSGGNKQKVVFAKWIGRGSDILILDCPTRGVDIGVKRDMYQLMAEFKKQGKAILIISEELPELIGMSDRLLIMKNGRIEKEFLRSETLSDADVIGYMI
ncbi:MAG: sugar ABC transporter ATP-binding protein [Clostridia bacterium]|nr:sugar ABC transporter ATP-binding protein [Clostridia bacterium]